MKINFRHSIASSAPAVRAGPDGYILVWSDEFDGEALDPAKWTHRTDSKHWSTQRSENVALSAGKLILRLKKENVGGKDYTGAGVISRRTFKFGYFEAALKVPSGGGWHTSFWLMKHAGSEGADDSHAGRELVHVCENDSINPCAYGANIHRWHQASHNVFGQKIVITPDLSDDFHVFGCEITPATVGYFFDGQLVQTVSSPLSLRDGHDIWLTCIAGPMGDTRRVDDTRLPAAAEVDWVRVYERGKG